MRTFAYPARIEADEGGRLLVTFPDFPDAATDGADLTEALAEAADVLSTALIERLDREEAIPAASEVTAAMVRVAPDATTAAKTALYLAFKAAGISGRELGRRLGIDAKEARRLLAPREVTKLPRIEQALAALGQHLEIVVYDAPREEAKPATKRAARQVRKVREVMLTRNPKAAPRVRARTTSPRSATIGKSGSRGNRPAKA